MKTWWTSDTHFSHENILKYANRPFASVDEMNAGLIANWNRLVAPEDTVWHLGDLAMGDGIQDQIALTRELNGHKRLVPGNHDRISSTYDGGSRRERFLPLYEAAGWHVLPEIVHHEIAGIEVIVCHFPYVGDSGAEFDRFPDARPLDVGIPIIHGHVHTTFAESGRQFNVGVDVRNYSPVAEHVIVSWLQRLATVAPESGRD